MRAFLVRMLVVGLLVVATAARAEEADDSELAALQAEFQEYSGAQLAFRAADLPAGPYYDVLPELTDEQRLAAAKIACREVQKYPPQYLSALRFKAIGIFRACASQVDDEFHPYDKDLQGYRYFGLYNGRDAVVAAYYSDEQLPLTLHHEIFHHIDRVTSGTPKWTDPPRMASGLKLQPGELTRLEKLNQGCLLLDSVSAYAAKNPAEDKAETARYFLSTLPDSLLQMVGQPKLAGSRRLLHVLDIYGRSNSGGGPTPEWFAAIAPGAERLAAVDPEKLDADALVLMLRLRRFAFHRNPGTFDHQQAVDALNAAEVLIPRLIEPAQTDELVRLLAALQLRTLRERIQPDGQFIVRGREEADGVNRVLRDDVKSFVKASERMVRLTSWSSGDAALHGTTQVESVRLLDAYYRFIAQRWKITPGTRQVFQQTCDRIAATLPPEQSGLAVRMMQSSLEQRVLALTEDGRWIPPPPSRTSPAAEPKNAHLTKVDAEVPDAVVRAAIRRVQPACVQLSNGSGVNVSSYGCVLTAAHVAQKRGNRLTATFPDGQQFQATCIATDAKLDLAICRLDADEPLPVALLAMEPPTVGTPVICIGQPGTSTPEGKPTDYEPFNVSAGKIRGFLSDPLGPQSLGRTKHDAWTYWGHSGSPLFNEQGEIVALHNSWDPETAMRHAVTQQAIAAFLAKHLPLASAER